MQAPLCMNNVVGEEIQRQDRQDCQDDDKKKVMEILQGNIKIFMNKKISYPYIQRLEKIALSWKIGLLHLKHC